MAEGKVENGKFWARCEVCGGWRPVELSPCGTEPFFAHFQAEFSCCRRTQQAVFTVEKDELDFH